MHGESTRHDRYVGRLNRFIGGEYREWEPIKLQFRWACIQILEIDRGYPTPFENFISTLLMHSTISNGENCTPALIAEDAFAEFKEQFQDAIDIARMMNKRHAELVNPPEEPAQS